tara:strand:+ start:221 stop:511 length:291 start_codon:yes stop_codon:yes gene_type:complete
MDVRSLTFAIQLMADDILNLHNKLDNDMFNHISYVSNRCLMILKKKGANRKTLEQCGKYLFRLRKVTKAYGHKKKNVTLDKIMEIVEEFKSVFSGI